VAVRDQMGDVLLAQLDCALLCLNGLLVHLRGARVGLGLAAAGLPVPPITGQYRLGVRAGLTFMGERGSRSFTLGPFPSLGDAILGPIDRRRFGRHPVQGYRRRQAPAGRYRPEAGARGPGILGAHRRLTGRALALTARSV
jgi:hypothetical protein